MSFDQRETADAVYLTPAQAAMGSVIWMHGLGADGHDFVPIVPELDLPARLALRFVFPHAPVRPVAINNGYAMRAWYDIKGIGVHAEEDAAGIRASAERIGGLIAAERALGIPPDKIVLAGFSQGGAIALHAALRHSQRLAGVLALSTYLPLRDTLAAERSPANQDVPILMCHGIQDDIVPRVLGTMSCDHLQTLGYAVQWREYAMQHQVCMAEINDIAAWLEDRFS